MSALPRSVGHLKGVTREAWLDALFMIVSIPGHKPDYDWRLRSQKRNTICIRVLGAPLYVKMCGADICVLAHAIFVVAILCKLC